MSSFPIGLAVMGSTGSIGTQTLALVRSFPDKFQVISLAAGKNIELLRKQLVEFHPKFVAVGDATALPSLKQDFPQIVFSSGNAGLLEALEQDGVHTVVMGLVGFTGLSPTLHAIRLGKRIALANKESLVVGGSLLQEKLKGAAATVIPVDSEHNALYQLLENRPLNHIASLVLTASGGPLWSRPEMPLEEVTPEVAVRHPNWSMGPKISVDSATLFNKGLELIEAHYLFQTPEEKIEVWVHPQSILHGAIWLTDNTCLAQLGRPDMKASIGYALGYPERLPGAITKLNLSEMSRLEFHPPDTNRFPALRLAREALRAGQSAVIALNRANELAVDAFLKRQISFPAISSVLQECLSRHEIQRISSLDDVFSCDEAAARYAVQVISRHFR